LALRSGAPAQGFSEILAKHIFTGRVAEVQTLSTGRRIVEITELASHADYAQRMICSRVISIGAYGADYRLARYDDKDTERPKTYCIKVIGRTNSPIRSASAASRNSNMPRTPSPLEGFPTRG
jgi:hypothetical protein